jgi:hypothetical protein
VTTSGTEKVKFLRMRNAVMHSRLKRKRKTKAEERREGKNRCLNEKHSSLRDPFTEQEKITGHLRGPFHDEEKRYKNVKLSL